MSLSGKKIWLVIALTGMVIAPRVSAAPLIYDRTDCDSFLKYSDTYSVKGYIACKAKEKDVDVKTVLFIAEHETQYGKWSVGDQNFRCPKTGKKSPSFGVFQINRCFHKVTKEQATDIVFSTDFALNQIKVGNAKLWSSYKFCKKFYNTCPNDISLEL